ncbi:type II toxin-antitoxin system HipA family toxin [Haliangium sp.]|uniref:type II toxin-antitoxin system HipA family toxin n=1 Tax=Haliangium sp. TaxID=2663208 RepID=UPI003D1176ED
MDAELGIYLNDLLVGHLRIDDNAHGRTEFRLSQAYLSRYPRPVLGQHFEDDLDAIHVSYLNLPPFFSNLLPEGTLRRLVARDAGVNEAREFYLLAHLGDDLPGAVRALPLTELDRADIALSTPDHDADAALGLRFSLAGMQLKFSMLRRGRGLTLPAHGQGGDWIVKLPDSRIPDVPEIEYATMQWARAADIDTPDCELVPMSQLGGLPPSAASLKGQALAVRRFDRPDDGSRIHQEDFAQVLGLRPGERYKKHNYETIGAIILEVAGPADFEAYVSRLVFMVLSGNADAHHKNWSLRYPDGVRARLAPAYDQVAVVVYVDDGGLERRLDDLLALNLAGSKHFEDVSLASFTRMARRLEYHEDRMRKIVTEAVERIRDAWPEVGLDPTWRTRIERHWQRIPLLRGA